jgi:hypothetical protein
MKPPAKPPAKIPAAHVTDSPSINAILQSEIEEFFERYPKCRNFTEIFDYLRSLEISEDTAADVAKSLLWAESRSLRAKSAPGENGRFSKRFDTDMVVSLLNEAGRSWSDLCAEAKTAFGMGKSTFAKLLDEVHRTGRCYKTPQGNYGVVR